ncbi:hypothetical protein [Fretibacter rubidus]|uniref:hypothetical protein n=1 Tax=Fretibacter rubidus TaxID=570162 RepID=UPI00352BCC10
MPNGVRNTVIQSLSAVGATAEAQFYAEVFASQDPERFALIVLDPRCLKNPLLEALVSNLRILADLRLTPVLLVGALDDDHTSVKFQSQRLTKALGGVGVKAAKRNTASYGLVDELRKLCRANRMPVLEMSDANAKFNLQTLVSELDPAKTIFLQPSGGLTRNGERIAVLNIDAIEQTLKAQELTVGQRLFLKHVQTLDADKTNKRVYVIASPLNLLAELFTTKGSGTLLRRSVKIKRVKSLNALNEAKLRASVNDAFGKPLRDDFMSTALMAGVVEVDYRGGALFTSLAGMTYLSKFWVSKEARGEGIARDLWDAATEVVPDFFWRSRMENPFNDWYMRACDGMQISGDWRVFWKGLSAPEIPTAIIAAASSPDDFKSE